MIKDALTSEQKARVVARQEGFEAGKRANSLRLECLKLAHNHADTQDTIIARANTYLNWVTNAGQS